MSSAAQSPIGLLQAGPLPEWDLEPLRRDFQVHRYYDMDGKRDFLTTRGPSIRAIATRGEVGADAALIDALPNLEIIAIYGVGYDAVDMQACRERGITVTNTPGVLTGDVADFAVAMMLCHARGMIGAEQWARSGDWAAKGAYPLSRRAFGKRAGVLGLGNIGRAVADRLAAFGMEIAYGATSRKDTPADWTYLPDPVDLARRSDFLFLTLAANRRTRHIVDRSVIEALGPEGMLINVSRAAVVDEEALLNALEDGRLGFAALDVFEGEPALNPRFLPLGNVLLQPHHGSATVETRRAMGQMLRDNLSAHFKGEGALTPVL